MSQNKYLRKINIPNTSSLLVEDYQKFLERSHSLMSRHCQYLAPSEDINSLELAHLLPRVPETILAIYVGINDAVCNKSLVTAFLVRHSHNNVFVFDPQIYSGGNDVPKGTLDASGILSGFEPPNSTWDKNWTYVMIEDTDTTFESLWQQRGYIDMIPAKFEDFTMLSSPEESKLCIFIDPKAFDHPVNKNREYLNQARNLGEKTFDQFQIPKGLEGEVEGLAPVVLQRGEKLYVATKDFAPCAHAWSNLHENNRHLAVVNENSAIPLDLVIAKPPANSEYAKNLVPPRGSADMTTDWFYRADKILRTPLLEGMVKG